MVTQNLPSMKNNMKVYMNFRFSSTTMPMMEASPVSKEDIGVDHTAT